MKNQENINCNNSGPISAEIYQFSPRHSCSGWNTSLVECAVSGPCDSSQVSFSSDFLAAQAYEVARRYIEKAKGWKWTTPNPKCAGLALQSGELFDGASTGIDPLSSLHSEVSLVYQRVPLEYRKDFHMKCAEAQTLSRALHAGFRIRDLRGAVSVAVDCSEGMVPVRACSGCRHVLKELGIVDGASLVRNSNW